MKRSKITFVLCFVFLLAFNIYAQEKPSIKMYDTLNIKTDIGYKTSGNLSANIINPQQFLYQEKDFLKLRAKINAPSLGEIQKPLVTLTPQNILSPLYSQYLEDQKNDTWRSILGTLQVGAVGYLAYKHIQKYGFK